MDPELSATRVETHYQRPSPPGLPNHRYTASREATRVEVVKQRHVMGPLTVTVSPVVVANIGCAAWAAMRRLTRMDGGDYEARYGVPTNGTYGGPRLLRRRHGAPAGRSEAATSGRHDRRRRRRRSPRSKSGTRRSRVAAQGRDPSAAPFSADRRTTGAARPRRRPRRAGRIAARASRGASPR